MTSPSGISRLLKMPLYLILAVIKYIVGATKFRKYEKSLIMCLRLTMYREAMLMAIPDTKVLNLMSNTFLLKLFKRRYKPVVESSLPGCGEPYTCGFWFAKCPDRSKLDPVIIYLHGGGYFMQTQMQQLMSLAAMYAKVDPKKKLSILFLDYDLVCHGYQFPRQLRQLDCMYTKLVEEGNDNILLMGDSAGGHLAISYTQFISMKKPYLPFPTKLLLISPWVNMNPTYKDYKPGKSFYDNQPRDMINFKSFEAGNSSIFIEDRNRPHHEYFEWSVGGDPKWNQNPFYNKSNYDIFVICGEDESFRDHIIEWTEQIYNKDLSSLKAVVGKSNHQHLPEFEIKINDPKKPKLEFSVEPWGIHDSFFFMEFKILDQIMKSKPINRNDYFAFFKVVDYLNKSL